MTKRYENPPLGVVLRKKMPWCLRDPLHGLLHVVSKFVSVLPSATLISYWTWCGRDFTVDDVNAKTMIVSHPTCLRCVTAPVLDDLV